MLEDEFLKKCTHALVAVPTDQIISNSPQFTLLHIAAYQKQPTAIEIDALYAELETDEELGITDMIPRKDYMLMVYNWKDIQPLL